MSLDITMGGLVPEHRVTELLAANNREVERRRAAEHRLESITDAARALLFTLDAIEDDPSYAEAWVFLAAHGYKYSGPNWDASKRALRDALKEAEGAET